MPDLRPGVFAEAALAMHAAGLFPLPCSEASNGKAPAIAWARFKQLPRQDIVRDWVARYPTANVGIVTGLSRVTIVDIDDNTLLTEMCERFGKTPLITETPSGGMHLWFRSAGERCTNLRKEGLNVDIKGKGGFVVTPPSVRPSGPYAGIGYVFRAGSLDDVQRLPTIRSGSLPVGQDIGKVGKIGRPIQEGQRGNALFRFLLRQAMYYSEFDAILDAAREENIKFQPPLSDEEVIKTAKSAWKYEITERNFVGKGARVHVDNAEYSKLARHIGGMDALGLLVKLRFEHYDRPEFAASPKAMAGAKVIEGWGHDRYRGALRLLVESGILAVVCPGGHGQNDPRIFRFLGPSAS